MLELPDVTLVCVDCVNPAAAEAAIAKSTAGITFGKVLYFTSAPTKSPHAVAIPPITSFEEYSNFIVYELAHYLETSHCLIIQHDGWVCNPAAWDPAWLSFDYVGGNAHWTEKGPEGKGGNGGFSLRSKRLLAAAWEYVHPFFGCHPEDLFFSSSHCGRKLSRRWMLEPKGFRFATRTDQKAFCNERGVWNGEFGHHKCDLARLTNPGGAGLTSSHVYQYGLDHLGDQWAAVNWLLKESERTGMPLRLARSTNGTDHTERLAEIIALIDSVGSVDLVDDVDSIRMRPSEVLAAEPYLPTRQRWSGPGAGVCYQFDGMPSARRKTPQADELEQLEHWCADQKGVRLGKHLSLGQCVEIMARSALFIGVCSGMSHLAHSVGVPTFIIEYDKPIRPFHLGKNYTRCTGTADGIAKAEAFLAGP